MPLSRTQDTGRVDAGAGNPDGDPDGDPDEQGPHRAGDGSEAVADGKERHEQGMTRTKE